MSTFNVELPDGRIIEGVPKGTTKAQIMAKVGNIQPSAEDGMTPRKEQGFLSNVASGLETGAKSRALGLLQLGMEATGNTDNPYYKDTQDLAAQYQNEAKGTGVGGVIGEIAGDPLTYATLPFGAGATSIAGLAAVGALGGGAAGLTQPYAENQSRLTGTAIGAGAGAVLAPVGAKALQYGGRLAEKTVVNPVRDAATAIQQKITSPDKFAIEVRGGMSYDDLAQAVSSLGQDAVAAFKSASKAGMTPDQAYVFAKAKSQGVNLTRGQITQDPAIQRIEDAAAMNTIGQDAYTIADNTAKSNNAAMRNYAGNLASDIAGGSNPVIDETTVANSVSGAFRNKADELKYPASEAYKAGLQSKSTVSSTELSDFPAQLKSALSGENIEYGASPMFRRDLKVMENIAKTKDIKWSGIEKFKQQMNSKARYDVNLNNVPDYAQRQEILAYRKASRMVDDKMDDLITNNLLQNPDAAAAELSKAPALYRNYKQTIFGKDGKAALSNIVTKDLTDKQVADLFGNTALGRGDTQKVVGHLKTALGEDSPAFGQVRAMFLNRLMNGALTKADKVGEKEFGTAVRSNLLQLKTKNKALYDELYTPAQQAEIEDFAHVAYTMSNKVRSKTNPSGSGVYAVSSFTNLLQRMGGVAAIAGEAAKVIAGDAGKSAIEKQATQSIINPLKRIGADTRIISEGLRAAGATIIPKEAAELGRGKPTRITINPAMQGKEGIPDVALPPK